MTFYLDLAMNNLASRTLSTGLSGAVLGLIVFYLSSYNVNYYDSDTYFWGFLSYLLWGGIFILGADYVLRKVDLSSTLQVRLLAAVFCLISLMLFTNGQNWMLHR